MNSARDPGNATIIDGLLRESTTEESDALRPVLLQLRALRTGEPPVPSPEVAALLVPDTTNVILLDAAPRRSRRAVFTILAVTATLGAGTAAAAAVDEGFRTGLQNAVATIFTALTTGTHPSPAVPSVTPAPAVSTAQPPAPPSSGNPSPGTQVASAGVSGAPSTGPETIPSWLTPGSVLSPTDPTTPHADADAPTDLTTPYVDAPAPQDQRQTPAAPSPAESNPVQLPERKRP
jgi:hypothetical protein